MRKIDPLVTVITPAFNRALFLDETILSVLNQDYPNLEYIVLDDGSTDATLQVIKKYEGRLRWDRHENIGEHGTINKGFAMSSGEFIVIVNSDDPLLPGAISEGVALMEQCPDALAAYPDWNEVGPNSEFIREVKLSKYNIRNMLSTFSFGIGPGAMIRRKALDLIGVRDPQFRYASDIDFWLRLALRGEFVHILKALATHRTHPDSASVSDRGAKMADELPRVLRKFYVQPNLPEGIKRLRRRAFSVMHFEAASYCGTDRCAVLKHRLASFRYDPVSFVIRTVALSMLKNLLPKRTYGALRSRWEGEGQLWHIRRRLSSRAGLPERRR